MLRVYCSSRLRVASCTIWGQTEKYKLSVYNCVIRITYHSGLTFYANQLGKKSLRECLFFVTINCFCLNFTHSETGINA